MERETKGTVISVAKQWCLKVNTKAVRLHALDGATFPHIITVKYMVDGVEYRKRKWIHAGYPVPGVDSTVRVIYNEDKPSKARVL